MSTAINLPPAIQEKLLRLQQLQQTIQTVLAQKQQLDVELLEIDQALTELDKTTNETAIYKSIGSLLIKSMKPDVLSDLNEKKELSNMRVSVLQKQEERLRKQIKELQTKLENDLRPLQS